MSDFPKFDSRPTKHVVIERIAGGPWPEHARFVETGDADDYAIWRRTTYEAIFAAKGFEVLVIAADSPATGNVSPAEVDVVTQR